MLKKVWRTLLNNRQSTKKMPGPVIGTLWKVTFSSFRNAIFQNLLRKTILTIFLFRRFQLKNSIEIKLCWNFSLEDRFFEKLKNQLDPFMQYYEFITSKYLYQILKNCFTYVLHVSEQSRGSFDDWKSFNTEKSDFLQILILILSHSQINKFLKHSISETRKCGLSDVPITGPGKLFLVLFRILSSVWRSEWLLENLLL